MVDAAASGLITMTFDDGLLCQFENGYPVLHEQRVKGVVFIPTGLVGDWYEGQPSMGLSHLHELASAGWEIGSHTVSHLRLVKEGRTKLPRPALEAELRESRQWILANGFPVISFSYPFGQYNDETAELARRYYRYMRTTEQGLNEVSSRNTRLKAFNLCQKSIERWKLDVEAALTLKKWLIATIHTVVESADLIPSVQESRCITREALAECLRYALSLGLPFRTFQEVYDACQDPPDAAGGTWVPPPERPSEPAGVKIRVRIRGSTAKITIKDDRRGFMLRFQHGSAERTGILSEISKRIAFDLELSAKEIEGLAEFC